MQSNKLIKIAKKVKMKNKELFDTLIEFEKTKKIRNKTRLNFTIDRTVASKFKKFCREKGYNMSAIIEKAMKKEMGEK
ncbi:hypothetical protein J4230_02420 [Candidatus Woesearchaeota archaeon]|nr:hypothetical protein [Candidatus Woesearchaeota archaeon]